MTTYNAKLDVSDIDDLAALPNLTIGYVDPHADNNARATFAADALVAYVKRVGDAGELETSISDLLGDLMHLCDGTGVDYDGATERAYRHYLAEINGQD